MTHRLVLDPKQRLYKAWSACNSGQQSINFKCAIILQQIQNFIYLNKSNDWTGTFLKNTLEEKDITFQKRWNFTKTFMKLHFLQLKHKFISQKTFSTIFNIEPPLQMYPPNRIIISFSYCFLQIQIKQSERKKIWNRYYYKRTEGKISILLLHSLFY